MDETRHGGDEVNKEDETVMDDAQGSSMFNHSLWQLKQGGCSG
jgi:hypothetical protein